MSVFHLKYRPSKISELDLPEVSEKLTKILSLKDMPQSWLFAGPKGSGKTSAARILAKAVNCLTPEGIEPCDKCKNCQEIARGNSLDIIEIDGASNRGVDDIRSLKESAYLSPVNLKKKVVIIDEVHMLTKEAFNALLKVLEEPPKNLIFILCTTDDNKIPETVLSRLCQLRFVKGDGDSLRKSLNKIIKGEKIEIDDDAIGELVEKSDGSFRNLQRNFNEIYLQTGAKISLEDVKNYLSRNGEYTGEVFESDLVLLNVDEIIEKIETLAQGGTNFSDLREKWMGYFQSRLISFYGIGQKNSAGLDLISVKKILDLLIFAGGKEKLTQIGQLPLEMVVVEFLNHPPAPTLRNEGEVESINLVNVEVVEKKTEVIENKVVAGDVEDISKRWGEVLIAVKPFNHSVEAFLRAARPKSLDRGILTLEVFYKFHKERLEEAKNRQIVLTGLQTVLGNEIDFRCVLATSSVTPTRVVVQSGEQTEKKDEKEIFV